MKKHFLLLIIVLFGAISIQAGPYKVKYLTADNGLSRNFIDNIFKDSKGFIWISTNKGLDRYDGYEFIHYTNRNPVNTLPSDNVHCVNEDNNGNLWIGTENGLYYMDSETGIIDPASKIISGKHPFFHDQIVEIYKDDQGNLWICHETGLTKISYNKSSYSASEIYSSDTGISCVLLVNDNVYAGHNNQLLRFVKGNTGKYQLIKSSNKLLHFTGVVTNLFYDNGLIWIGTGDGLYKYDQLTESITHYINNPFDSTSLSSNSITDIKKNKEGQLLIGTLIGLDFYDYHTDNFTRLTTDPNSEGIELNNNFVNCILTENNMIWVGTDKGGINLLTPNHNLFKNIGHIPGNPSSLSKNPVNAIYEDNDSDMLIGTVEGGLNIQKKGSKKFIHATAIYNDPHSLSHNSVSCICQDYKKDYWIGTWGNGLNFMKHKDKYHPYFDQFLANSGSNSLVSNFVAALVPDDGNQGIWIGTRGGLDFYNIDTKKFTHILNYLSPENHIRFVTGMLLDSKRRLWVGTGFGLYCIYLKHTDLKKNKIRYRYFRYLLSNPKSRIVEKINCIIETKNHEIWFGSSDNGIYKLEEHNGRMSFINYDESTGLLDNMIYGMLEDETGTLWLSTDRGLCAFNTSQKSIRSYTKSDGLKTNQFYWDAYCKAFNGDFYFGDVAGYTIFDPLKSTIDNRKNNVSITRFKILNEDVYPGNRHNNFSHLKFDSRFLSEIRLHEADKAFSVEFSALRFNQADKIKYEYRLKGFDKNWTEVSSDRRFANFTNINSGNYLFQVKCTNPDGNWSNQITEIKIEVVPPFYKTWWFLLIFIILVIYSVYRYYVYRINALKAREQQLQDLVDERTHEIGLQKEQLQEQAIQLQTNVKTLIEHQKEVSRQNEMLTEQNLKITLQKEELEELTKKLEEATIDKITFFTNITHEFRTPITLILGPVERSLKLSTNPQVLEQLNIVRRNSKLLLSLINQLMDFRKVESGKMELTKTQQNFIEFLDDLILPFEDLVKDRGITFQKQYRINHPEFLFDKDNLQKVISNLLSNAIKFTPDHGKISVVASTYTEKSDNKEKLYVAIKDTGKGIPETDLGRIFERFYQSKLNTAYSGSGQSGTGIGLYLCKQIISLHNGKIEALNQQAGGACFRFMIPIERRLSAVVSLDGKPMEMIVANQHEEHDNISHEIVKGKPVLLIVEDNADMRQYVRSILSSSYNVLEAPNGLVGLEVTKRYQPDLIISDIMMPEMDGMEFCKQVKSDFTTSHIPVVLLTAKSSTDTQIESFHLGADAFLIKPFDEELLKAMIVNLSEKRKRLQMSFSENMDTEALNFDDESLDKKFMDKALKTIKENYTNPDFDVTEFIEAMGISRSLLHKKLTNLSGQSASRFIRNYRLNIARELIIKNRASHTMNISEIAYEVGFNDPKYFTRCFTKHFGIQPSAFMEEDEDEEISDAD